MSEMKLYVGNLNYETNEHDLRELFEACGNIVDIKVIIDRDTGRSKGFAFVTMATKEEGDQAIAKYNGFEFKGRALTVNEARPKEEGSGGGSRGGFGSRAPRSSGFGGGNGGSRSGGGFGGSSASGDRRSSGPRTSGFGGSSRDGGDRKRNDRNEY